VVARFTYRTSLTYCEGGGRTLRYPVSVNPWSNGKRSGSRFQCSRIECSGWRRYLRGERSGNLVPRALPCRQLAPALPPIPDLAYGCGLREVALISCGRPRRIAQELFVPARTPRSQNNAAQPATFLTLGGKRAQHPPSQRDLNLLVGSERVMLVASTEQGKGS
jgi:hypothetical protein